MEDQGYDTFLECRSIKPIVSSTYARRLPKLLTGGRHIAIALAPVSKGRSCRRSETIQWSEIKDD